MITLSPDPRFPAGTVLDAYASTGDARPVTPTVLDTATVAADGTTTFSNLAEGRYVAGETVAGPFVAFNVPATSSGGTGGGHVIEDDGTPLTQRDTLNFTGAGVSAADAGGETVVTISGGAVNTVLYDEDLGDWPDRPSDDEAVSYIWLGPTFPDVGGAGDFIANVDVFIPDAEVPGGGPANNQGVIVWDGTGDLPDRPESYDSVNWVTFDAGDDPAANALDGDLWIFPL